ncbi:nitrate/nitrite sensor protein NarQ [compost metagenome]
MVFEIEDDGVGIDDRTKIEDGYGLRNVQERLSMYYGPFSTMQITSQVNEGTRVVLRLQLGGTKDA